MKKSIRPIIKGTNWALAGLLTLLGFAGCDNEDDPDGPIICEYGAPYAEYVIKGKVTGESGNPLADIPVVVKANFSKRPGVILDNYHLYTDTVYTDQQGDFEQKRGGFPAAMDMTVIANGVDGKKKENFATDSVKFNIVDKDFKGGEGWNAGTVEKTAPTIKLKENKPK